LAITIPYPLLQTVLVPAVFAVLCYPLSIRLGKRVGWVAFASVLYASLLLFLAEAQALGQSTLPSLESFKWAPSAGLTFGFLADNLSLPVALIVSFVLTAAAVYSMPYMQKRLESFSPESQKRQYGYYYMSYLLVCTGLLGIVLSTNLIELYLFLELVLIPTFVIISLFGYVEKERVAITYILWNQLGAFIFLAGILLAYSRTSSFDVSSLSAGTIGTGSIAYWVVGLILLGWLIKMAIFGLHMWLPVTEAEPPTSFAPIMAVVSGVGTYVIARLLLQGMPTVFQAFSLPLMVWAVTAPP